MFSYKINKNENKLEIVVEGEFDTEGANKLQTELESYNYDNVSSIKFDLSETAMMASSGLRVIYFTKDSIKKDMQVDVSGAKNLVLNVIKMSGISKFVNVI